MTGKTRENRARRKLRKMGYALQKCRNRADRYHYGQYRIIEINTNAIVTGERFDMSLGDVERFIEDWRMRGKLNGKKFDEW